jgi:hypothetical protein
MPTQNAQHDKKNAAAQSRAAADVEHSTGHVTPEFTDARAEAGSQQQLAQAAHDSPQVQQHKAWQAMADSVMPVQRMEDAASPIQLAKDGLREPHKKWSSGTNSVREANRRHRRAQERSERKAAAKAARFTTAIDILNTASKSHIMVEKHAWDLVIDPFVVSDEKAQTYDADSWERVKAIMLDVLLTGEEGAYKKVQMRSKAISGQTVEVTFTEVDNAIRISDAWVNTR